MLGAKISEALNDQFNAELYSGYLYLSMAAYLHSVGLPGFAQWMRVVPEGWGEGEGCGDHRGGETPSGHPEPEAQGP